jgi:MoaA/NifB/PqqE/SkfB family radical SAM enzyme
MLTFKEQIRLAKSLLSNPRIIKVRPAVNWFLLQYFRRFKIINVDDNFILHSHLPSLNSRAYTRFIDEHLLAPTQGPSHAQIGLTNACPQNCRYCYNKDRSGKVMDTATIKRIIQDLKKMGVFWLGFTGGEPLLNRDIVEITDSIGDDCAVKLFTTGCTLTKELAADLKRAGLLYVSVSLDHWQEEEYDRLRRYKGAFKTALQAIELFKRLGGIHVGVSAVLSKDMIKRDEVEVFLQFLTELEIHEAWISEIKPSVEAFWNNDLLITEEERVKLVELQDRYNKEGKITVNYLGHLEGREHFGCNAGCKMVYVDAFGEVSPCVFTPMTFGNVRESSIEAIYREMKGYFPSEESCFINKNYSLLRKYYNGHYPICKEDTLKLMQEVSFGPFSRFQQLLYR